MDTIKCYSVWKSRIDKQQIPHIEKHSSSTRSRLYLVLIIVAMVIFVLKDPIFANYIDATIKAGDFIRNFSFASMSSKIPSKKKVVLGKEEKIFMSGLKYVPDGHISKIEKDEQIRLFISAHDKSYMMFGSSLDKVIILKDSFNLPQPILTPGEVGFDKDYAGFGQVIENPKTLELMGIYHTEIRINPDASDSQLTSIALSISKDGGYTWKKIGKIVEGQNLTAPGTIVSGAGQPSGVIIGDYIYLYYSDWNRLMPDSIHLARSPIASNGMPNTWEKFTDDGFKNVGAGGKSIPVIAPFKFEKTIYYTANPSISYNIYLKKYLAIFETNIGFFMATSTDGIEWGSYELIYEFPADTTKPKKNGDIWYSYPTYISENTPSDMVTAKEGYLYFGRGVFGEDHQLVRRKFNIK